MVSFEWLLCEGVPFLAKRWVVGKMTTHLFLHRGFTMRLQVLSDIHLEFHRDQGLEFMRSLGDHPEGIEGLVLAGDVCPIGWNNAWLLDSIKRLCGQYPHVFMVLGNHDYWGDYGNKTKARLETLDNQLSGFHFLHHGKVVEVEGKRFYGDTLWFPQPPSYLYPSRYNFIDYQKIKAFEPWVYNEHEAFLEGLEKAGEVDVVVTHHIPSEHCIAPQFKGSSFNHYFCHDLTTWIEEKDPPVWVFGHTHTSMDKVVGRTRLICNPFGYPHEPKDAYQEKMVVTI